MYSDSVSLFRAKVHGTYRDIWGVCRDVWGYTGVYMGIYRGISGYIGVRVLECMPSGAWGDLYLWGGEREVGVRILAI